MENGNRFANSFKSKADLTKDNNGQLKLLLLAVIVVLPFQSDAQQSVRLTPAPTISPSAIASSATASFTTTSPKTASPTANFATTADPEKSTDSSWREQVQQDKHWRAYFAESERLLALDQAFLAAELQRLGSKTAIKAEKTKKFGFDDKPTTAFLQSAEAARVARVILSFQTPSGGWSKRTDMAGAARKPGQQFGVEKNYIPTFDNGATSTQLRWLAAFYPYADAPLKALVLPALEKGVQFVLKAQYPNGGFAQTYPLRGGYHDAVTLNDQVMVAQLRLLKDVASHPGFAMLPQALRQQAAEQFKLGISWLLRAQIRLKGQLTVWAAQHHPVDLSAVQARAYELPALVSSESAAVVLLLMEEQAPSDDIKQSVEAAVRWFSATQIRGMKLVRDDKGARLAAAPETTKALWARFYDLTTQQPLFVDRNGKQVAAISELSLERQLGYGWYQSDAAAVLKAYPRWQQQIKMLNMAKPW